MDPLAGWPEDRRAGRLRAVEVSLFQNPPPRRGSRHARRLFATNTDCQMPEPSSSPRRRKFNFFDATEKPTEWLIRLCGWSSIVGLAAIFLFIFREAAPMVPKLNWVYFFTSPRWIPNPAEGNEASFGALALLVGTFTTTFLGL